VSNALGPRPHVATHPCPPICCCAMAIACCIIAGSRIACTPRRQWLPAPPIPRKREGGTHLGSLLEHGRIVAEGFGHAWVHLAQHLHHRLQPKQRRQLMI
jgi:hypothetical protein